MRVTVVSLSVYLSVTIVIHLQCQGAVSQDSLWCFQDFNCLDFALLKSFGIICLSPLGSLLPGNVSTNGNDNAFQDLKCVCLVRVTTMTSVVEPHLFLFIFFA